MIDGRQNAGAAFAADSGAMKVAGMNGPAVPPLTIHVDCKANPRKSGDVLRVLDIPAGLEASVVAVLETKEGAALTIDAGTYDLAGDVIDDNVLLSGFNANGTDGGKRTTGAAVAPSTDVDSCVCLKFNEASAHAVIDLVFAFADARVNKGGDSSTRYANVS
jgi:hypothetical protein